MDYIIGLDLGQEHDYTALAVVARPEDDSLHLPHLQRFLLHTPYPDIVTAVARIVSTPQLKRAPLIVDQTGVGRPVVDLLRTAVGVGRIIPVTITSGQAASVQPDGSRHVPKKGLVTSLVGLLEDRRLKVARNLVEARTLVDELLNFKMAITDSANVTYGAWRSGQHDDLVLAVALACWWAEGRARQSAKSSTDANHELETSIGGST